MIVLNEDKVTRIQLSNDEDDEEKLGKVEPEYSLIIRPSNQNAKTALFELEIPTNRPGKKPDFALIGKLTQDNIEQVRTFWDEAAVEMNQHAQAANQHVRFPRSNAVLERVAWIAASDIVTKGVMTVDEVIAMNRASDKLLQSKPEALAAVKAQRWQDVEDALDQYSRTESGKYRQFKTFMERVVPALAEHPENFQGEVNRATEHLVNNWPWYPKDSFKPHEAVAALRSAIKRLHPESLSSLDAKNTEGQPAQVVSTDEDAPYKRLRSSFNLQGVLEKHIVNIRDNDKAKMLELVKLATTSTLQEAAGPGEAPVNAAIRIAIILASIHWSEKEEQLTKQSTYLAIKKELLDSQVEKPGRQASRKGL